jgi:hypothetical protein
LIAIAKVQKIGSYSKGVNAPSNGARTSLRKRTRASISSETGEFERKWKKPLRRTNAGERPHSL